MSKVPPDPPLLEMKLEPEDESSSEGSSGSVSDSDDSEDLENSRKIQEFQEKVSYYLGIFKNSFHVGFFVIIIIHFNCTQKCLNIQTTPIVNTKLCIHTLYF